MKLLKDPYEKFGECDNKNVRHSIDDVPLYKKVKKAMWYRRLFTVGVVILGLAVLTGFGLLMPPAILMTVLQVTGVVIGVGAVVGGVGTAIEYNAKHGRVLKNAKRFGVLEEGD